MPQFDLFIWVSLSFWTIFIFQALYFVLIYYILAPFSNIQKTLIKLYLLNSNSTNNKDISFFILEHSINSYFNYTNQKS